MSSIMSLDYAGSLGYSRLPEYATPFFPSFEGQHRAEHLPAGCHVVYPRIPSYTKAPPSPQGRAMVPFSKYSPYHPFLGMRLDEHLSAFRVHKPSEKSAFQPPANVFQDHRMCTCNCTLTPSRVPAKRPMCSPEYYNWLFPNDRFSHPSDDLPISLRLSSLTTRPYPMLSRRLDENEKQPAPKRFQCPHCEKSFGKSSHLRDHIRTHTGDRPYRCQYCDKAFTQYSNLRTHTRIHTGERPYRCTHCNKSFTQAVTLRSHTRTHLGEKAYHCKQCAKSFPCFSGLKGHIRVHESSQAATQESRSDTELVLNIKQERLEDEVTTQNEK